MYIVQLTVPFLYDYAIIIFTLIVRGWVASITLRLCTINLFHEPSACVDCFVCRPYIEMGTGSMHRLPHLKSATWSPLMKLSSQEVNQYLWASKSQGKRLGTDWSKLVN